MTIVVIKGPAASGKTTIANALRNYQISQGKGALIIDETTGGELKPLLEKIIKDVALPDKAPKDLSQIPWKKESMIIVVGSRVKMLDDIEKILPGFKEFFSPVRTINTGVAK